MYVIYIYSQICFRLRLTLRLARAALEARNLCSVCNRACFCSVVSTSICFPFLSHLHSALACKLSLGPLCTWGCARAWAGHFIQKRKQARKNNPHNANSGFGVPASLFANRLREMNLWLTGFQHQADASIVWRIGSVLVWGRGLRSQVILLSKYIFIYNIYYI